MAREAPYNRLKRIAAQWIEDKVLYRRRRQLWTLDLEHKSYSLSELRYKVETASTLGYTVELSTNDKGHVIFTYVAKLPEELPWELR